MPPLISNAAGCQSAFFVPENEYAPRSEPERGVVFQGTT